jgi:hypothetical protein
MTWIKPGIGYARDTCRSGPVFSKETDRHVNYSIVRTKNYLSPAGDIKQQIRE